MALGSCAWMMGRTLRRAHIVRGVAGRNPDHPESRLEAGAQGSDMDDPR